MRNMKTIIYLVLYRESWEAESHNFLTGAPKQTQIILVKNTHTINKYLQLFSEYDEMVKTVEKMRFSEMLQDIRTLKTIVFEREYAAYLLGHFE